MKDLSKLALHDETISTFKKMGVRLYVNYYDKTTFVNQDYWRALPELAKQALTIVHEVIEKENTINE